MSDELSEKANERYENIISNQDWIKDDIDFFATKIATKINVDMDIGLIDIYPATILAKEIEKKYKEEIDRLRNGISEIIKTVKPLSNFDSYQVLNMSPTQIINHCNELLGVKP